jgi:myo-inositol-1(or 4)-monophosphatase
MKIVDNSGENVDKTNFKNNFLANIMLSHKGEIDDLVRSHGVPNVSIKSDNSPVTDLDLALSGLIEEISKSNFPGSIFYSEEKFSHWGFPLLALDPLDGTREYVARRPEWALSIGHFLTNKFEGEGWVYNPVTGEHFDQGALLEFQKKEVYLGEVSRSELESGLFNFQDNDLLIKPMGSIAYKLGRLSAGKCDFVVSLRPKSIWDIAGGALLCQQAGLKFYSAGHLVTSVERVYQPPLIWCHEGLSLRLLGSFA